MKNCANNMFFTVYGWMISVLGLKDTELLVFSLIYNFTVNSENREYYGSNKHLAEIFMCSEPKISNILKNLVKKGYIVKGIEYQNGFIKKNNFIANIEKLKEMKCIPD